MLKKLSALAAPLVTLITGCEPSVAAKQDMELVYPRSEGQPEGQVQIAPQTHIAVYAEVRDAKKVYTAELTGASSSDEAIVGAAMDGGFARLSAKAAGQAVITLEGVIKPGDQKATKTLTVKVAEPAKVTLGHSCGAAKDAVYLVGEPIRVMLAVADAGGAAIVGKGAAPVTAQGAKLAPEADWADHLMVEAPTQAGEIKLRASVGEGELALNVIAREDLDGIKLEQSGPIKVGEKKGLGISMTSKGSTVCIDSLEYTVENLSPDLCELEIERIDADDFAQAGSILQADAKAAGVCSFKLKAGELVAELSITIE
jgi:hypothetical protein